MASRSHAAPARSEPATCSAMAAHAASATFTASAERGTRAGRQVLQGHERVRDETVSRGGGLVSEQHSVHARVVEQGGELLAAAPHERALFARGAGKGIVRAARARLEPRAPTAPISRSLSAPAGAACAAYALSVRRTSPRQFFTSPACILSNVLQGVGSAKDE